MGTYVNSPITIGDNNNIVIHSRDDNIQWEALKDDCLSVMTQLPKNSKEREAAEQLFADTVQKDGKKLKQTVKKYAAEFSSALFKGAASTLLAEFIKSILC